MKTNQEETVWTTPVDGRDTAAKLPLDRDGSLRTKPHAARRWTLVAGLLVLLGLVGWAIYWRAHSTATPVTRAANGRTQAGPVPVVEGVVATKDVPIYLDGLGTVQAFNTVTLHSRVDGQLIKVAFTEGQDVKAGDVLAQIDPAPYQALLDQAMAKKAQDEAQLANARLDLQRYVDLLAKDSITQQIYDTQKALLAQLEATIKADQAAIDSARVNLDYTTIRSPIDGRAGIRLVDQGNIVHAADATGLVVLTQLRPISVLFTLPEQALPKLQRAQTSQPFTVLALGRENTNLLAEGQLAVIDNQIDTTTGTIKLKATFANDQLRLWPGQFVNMRLHLTTRTNGVIVPASVVQRGPEGPFAFVIQNDQTVMMRSLQVAQIEHGQALIDEGLQPGERVVVDGQYKLQANSQVRTVPPQGKAPGQAPSKAAGEASGQPRMRPRKP